MLKKSYIRKICIATLFSMMVPFAFASLTVSGTVDEKAKSNKFSLKSLSSYSKRTFSLSVLRTNLQFKGNFLNQKGSLNTTSATSFLQFESGNTTYTLPFKLSFKTPKFKTPSANN